MNILDYFDVNDRDHLHAYRTLTDTGTWPEGFIPEGTTFSPVWQIGLASMLASAWVSHADSACLDT